jgi:hypothetical protein
MPLVPKLGEKKDITMLRTFRLDNHIIERLEEEANKQGTTVNGLVNNLLTDYVNVTTRLNHFGLMVITRTELVEILNSMDDMLIVSIASKIGSTLVKEVLMQTYGAASPYYLNLYIDCILCRYKKWANYSSEENNGSLEITLGHMNGLKWTTFLCNFIDSALFSISNKRLNFIYMSNYTIIFTIDVADVRAPLGFPLNIFSKGENKQ